MLTFLLPAVRAHHQPKKVLHRDIAQGPYREDGAAATLAALAARAAAGLSRWMGSSDPWAVAR